MVDSDFISITDDNKVQKKIITQGLGDDTPKDGEKAKVHYVGKLESGNKFDSSRDRNTPFEFTVGQGVITGWSKGVATMKKGEIALFKIDSDYGYGDSGSPPTIPPKATLYFEIELLNWDKNIPPAEKIKIGQDEKNKGNELFKQQKFEDALVHYQEAEAAVEFHTNFGEEEQKEVDSLCKTIFGNLSACLLKLSRYEEAVQYCNKVLNYESADFKTFFRRASAYEKQKMYEEALADIQRALSLAKDNSALLSAEKRLKRQIAMENQRYKQKQKKVFAGMFEKIDFKTPEPTNDENKMEDEETQEKEQDDENKMEDEETQEN